MNVVVITTSRADYGIYASLLRRLAARPEVSLSLLVSGTHLSASHGHTVRDIERDGYRIIGRVAAVPEATADGPADIAALIGTAIERFAAHWRQWAAETDLVIALGDRYEMFAAVTATLPFNLPVAHLHGGETTLGAMDDRLRHAITQFSRLHFTATAAYADRVAAMIGTREGVYHVGAPGLDGLSSLVLPTVEELREKISVDLTLPTVLVTLHPETVDLAANQRNLAALLESIDRLAPEYQFLVTLPNADTQGTLLRRGLEHFSRGKSRVFLRENLGKLGYFAAMKYARFLLGNTSSGLLEAPSFGRFTINLGARQAGRVRAGNVLDVAAATDQIVEAVRQIAARNYVYVGPNPYVGEGEAATRIVEHCLTWFSER